MPDFSSEIALQHLLQETESGPKLIAGIDEAGCGPWAGPVVAGAVVFKDFNAVPKDLLDILDDSKKLSKKKRDATFLMLTGKQHDAFCTHASGIVTASEIDDLNIRKATMLAMKRAFDGLAAQVESPIEGAVIDGVAKPDLPCSYQMIIKGDSKSFSIAAASIIAKVTRDQMMLAYAEDYPEYGFEKHAGYGTKAHQEALVMYGVTPLHRQSFAPIKRLVEANFKGAA